MLRRSGAGNVLDDAVAYAFAKNYSGSGAWLDESGNGRDAQLGSTSGADSNDPLFLNTESGLPYLYLPGISGNYASAPDAAALDITGDLDLRAALAAEDWTPAATTSLVSKFVAGGNQRSYHLRLNTGGAISFQWSTDGTSAALVTATSTATLVVSDGALLLVRVTIDVDNGASGNTVTFYFKASTWATAFADLRAHTGWTQLGDPTVGGSTTSIFASTASLEIGSNGNGASGSLAGKVAAAAVYSGIAGTEAFAHNFTDLAAYNSTRTTATAATGQTVTINRSATGRKSTVVDRALFLLGTDDYFEVADHADLDFAASDSFTVAVLLRFYGTAANLAIIAKKTALAAEVGWALDMGTGGVAPEFTIADGTNESVDVAPTITAGVVTMVAGRRNVAADQIEGFRDGTGSGSPTTDATTATLANSEVLRIGRLSGAGAAQFGGVIIAWALFRRALTDAEMTTLATLLAA